MTQTQHNQKPATTTTPAPSLAAAAVAAATGTKTAEGPQHKADAAKTSSVTDADKTDADKAEGDESEADKKERVSRKVYVAVGEIKEFDSARLAEKFLNSPEAPSSYAVIRGNRIDTKKKVSLR